MQGPLRTCRLVGWAIAVLVAIAIAACGSTFKVDSHDYVWAIYIRHPEGDWKTCLQEIDTRDVIIAPSLPAAYVLIVLEDNLRRAASDTVAACIDERLTSGTVTVSHMLDPTARADEG